MLGPGAELRSLGHLKGPHIVFKDFAFYHGNVGFVSWVDEASIPFPGVQKCVRNLDGATRSGLKS